MRNLLLVIVLAFPFIEAAVLFRLFESHGAWVLGWLLMSAVMGVILIKQARFALLARFTSDFARGQFSLAALIDSARTVVAGLLLIFPGIVSDAIAMVLLLLPMSQPAVAYAGPDGSDGRGRGRQRPREPREAHVIDGDFRRE